MVDIGFIEGLMNAITFQNLLFCLLGVIAGTIVGVLPGLGPVGAISILLPTTLPLEPTTALIFIAGIAFGGMYGGSTTSILLKIPGTASAVATTLDGYPMAMKGRAGAALVIAAIASFVAGTISIVFLSYMAPLLANVALIFGPPEYFVIVFVGLFLLARITDTSIIRSYLLISVGIALSTIGMDLTSGAMRITFGFSWLIDGFDFMPVIMGLYGLSSILLALEPQYAEPLKVDLSLRKLMPTKKELKESAGPITRGGVIGFLMGLIPGPANVISTFVSYRVEKSISKKPNSFGKGAVAGLAAPEAANNAASTGTLVPLLSLGIPFSALPAIILAAIMLHGITPGPLFIDSNPLLFWTLIASFYIGNIALLILNIPLVGLFAKILYIPKGILMSLVMVFCFIGTYAVNYNNFDLFVLVLFSIIGFLLIKANMDASPIIIGMILGPILEMNYIQSMSIFKGDLTGFWHAPIAGFILKFALGLLFIYLAWKIITHLRKGQKN